MKNLTLITLVTAALAFNTNAMAKDNHQENTLVQQQYQMQLDKGKNFRDAFEALRYEIAYEQAAVQSKSPCRKLVRGL